MSDYPALPISIELTKTDTQGTKRITLTDQDFDISIDFKVLAPFTQHNIEKEPDAEPGAPQSGRQEAFETIIRLLGTKTAGMVPYRFRTSDGYVWRMESSAAYWMKERGHATIVVNQIGTFLVPT